MLSVFDILGMISAISNSAALSARFGFNRNLAGLNNALLRLSTGRRINSGKDDPAGLIASEQLAAELEALEAESASLRRVDANANISDGHASQLSGLYGELNGLLVKSANAAGTSDAEIAANQLEIDNIVGSIQRMTGETVSSLEGINIPNGGNAEVEALLTGASTSVASLASGGANDLASGNLETAQTAVKAAIYDVASARGKIGAYQKYTVESLYNSKQIAIENLAASKSQIVDTDYAVETSTLMQFRILAAASVNVLKIAQHQSQNVLNLLSTDR